MTHPRKLLRDSVKQRLQGIERGNATLAFEIATAQEVQSKPGAQLAWGSIDTPSETSQRAGKDASLDREVELIVSLQIDGDDPIALLDELDAWAELIEDRMRTDGPPAPAKRCTLTNTTLERGQDEQATKWLAFLDMQYAALIFS